MPTKDSVKLHSKLDQAKGTISSTWIDEVRRLINLVQGRAYQSGLDDGGVEHRFLVIHTTPSGEMIASPFENMEEYEGLIAGLKNQEYKIIHGEEMAFNEMRIELERRRSSSE